MKKITIITFSILFFSGIILGQPKEYLLKAGFLEKFASFTTWPANENMKDFTIAIMGKNPFNDYLETFYKNVKINKKNVIITYIDTIDEIDNVQMLFISNSEKDHINEILKQTQGKAILLIGDTEGFAKQGVHINLYETHQQTLHFEINAQSVKRSGLKIDALLLNYAKIVN